SPGGTPGSTVSNSQPSTEELWVAAKRLEPGTKLDDPENQLKKQRMFKDDMDSIRTLAINNREVLKNKTLKRAVDPGHFFTDEDFKEIVNPVVAGTKTPNRTHDMTIINGPKSDKITFNLEAANDENRNTPPGGSPDKKPNSPSGSEGK